MSIFFVELSNILPQLLLAWTELPKCNSAILIENCDQVIVSVIFLYAPAHKIWLFEKFIFELQAFLNIFKIIFIWVLFS